MVILPIIFRVRPSPTILPDKKLRKLVFPEPEEPRIAVNYPGTKVPETLLRITLGFEYSPYSQRRIFYRLGMVLTVRFSKVSYIFFLFDGLKDFLILAAKLPSDLTLSVPVSYP